MSRSPAVVRSELWGMGCRDASLECKPLLESRGVWKRSAKEGSLLVEVSVGDGGLVWRLSDSFIYKKRSEVCLFARHAHIDTRLR